MVNQNTPSLVSSCKDIERWMTTNKLKLNNDKTELLVLNASYLLPTMLNSIYAGTELITASKSVKNIGVLFDNLVLIDKQITSICKSPFIIYRNL